MGLIMVARTHGRAFAAGAAALALAATVGGCATDTAVDRPGQGAAGASRSPAGAASASASSDGASGGVPGGAPSGASSGASGPATSASTPAGTGSSAATSPSVPAATGPGASSGKVGLRGRLLTAEELPGPTSGFTWKPGRTRAGEGREPFGTCQRYAMSSIGAERVVTRSFLPRTKGAEAAHLVAQFPDEMTARRGYEVLKSWRDKCAEKLGGYARRTVGKLQSVPVEDGGSGGWYLLTYGPAAGQRDGDYLDAQGIVRSGNRVSLLSMRTVGQDYDYPAGKEPMVAAVRKAAEKLR